MSEKLCDVVEKAIKPALAALPARMRSREAVVMLLAIGLQESLFKYRRQIGSGIARGWLQFEKMGGVAGVIKHQLLPSFAVSVASNRHRAKLPLLMLFITHLSMMMSWRWGLVGYCFGLIQKHCLV